ncbi:unnamed protein product [Adineta ricciae]|uniref:Uncharacterized protein n=1 Tax=Adineta ricciae TaxID=249248 RepID=A0A815LKR0_ADIRI|nr:unnamed protein product [Adineta ricciae]
MSTAVQSTQLATVPKPKLDQNCSSCGSTAHFACIEHCKAILCSRCAGKHHVLIIRQMQQLLKRLKIYRIDSVRIKLSVDSLKQSLDSTSKSTSNLETDDPQQAYIILLDENLKKDRLIDSKILADLEEYLNDHAIRIIKTCRSSTISRSFETRRRLLYRPQTRSLSAGITWSKTVTASLSIQKRFQISNEPSTSLNEYPVAISLNDHYFETFFCQWEDNSVILLSRCAIDIFTRGSGLTWSIPIHHVLSNTKDKVLAGTWSSYLHRLILVGRYYFYLYDLSRQKVRSVCDCGCGGCCGVSTVPPKPDRYTKLAFRCPPIYDDYPNSPRFLDCSLDDHLFYAYKSGKDTYRLEAYSATQFFNVLDEEQAMESSFYAPTGQKSSDIKIKPSGTVTITGQIAAIRVTHDRIAVVYRRLREPDKRPTNWKNPLKFDHYFALYDHSLTKLTEEALLLSSIRWITSIVPFGTEYEYLLCDPLGQQLLLYQAFSSKIINRFHLACVQGCCLIDGRLVLWVRQAYPNSPIGKLHFMNAPHLEKYRMETKSLQISNESRD